MVLTRHEFEQSLQHRLTTETSTFYPGPVKQLETIAHSDLSHRSLPFNALYERVQKKLLHLSNANHVGVIVGTGTLANEVMLAQLKAQQLGKGLILTNGEFGERLRKQAARWSLHFEVVEKSGERYLMTKNWLHSLRRGLISGCWPYMVRLPRELVIT